ncbi:hypothetical protein [Noviherbaspirillum aridicola]|uniref:Uncharacterized protein n=1 Tax=Noviherbaspirillum aridicola TaxID=2849687 RepID=A0ABQ4Q9H2_9BURK|nr:hypothetical protein [Noviherbaspirillum aridicola]GIZ53850.1 hypothetical protein NCCP691_38640 [Noviherbaspirillum aridicola]
MHTLDVIDSALQWETERQNRLHQQALELKKKQALEDSHQAAPAMMPAAAVDAAPGLPDRVSRIPDMRSALIPFEETAGDEVWSKPFALTKADLEPWTSFLAGYNQSRLFLQPAGGAASAAAAQAQDPSHLDYAVRALLTLKRVPPRLVLEPPVQINRQVEYQDVEAELQASEGRLRRDTMLKLAQELHQKQLARAVEAGRKLGDDLYEAMMGEGYVNLIRAWERVHDRKPSIEELHVMLSTGKVKALPQRAPASAPSPTLASAPATTPASAPAVESGARRSGTAAFAQHAAPAAARPAPRPPAMEPVAEDDDDADALVSLGAARRIARDEHRPAPKAKPVPRIYWYLLHAAASSASAAALAWFWLG